MADATSIVCASVLAMPAFNGYGGGERPSTVARDRSAAGNIFSTYGRTLQNFDNTELSIWRRHVDRENLAVANHVGNQLSTTGLSFLRSSTSGSSGGWETNATRQSATSLTLDRLDSMGYAQELPGPLQLSSSTADFFATPRPSFGRTSRSQLALTPAPSSSSLLRRPGTVTSVGPSSWTSMPLSPPSPLKASSSTSKQPFAKKELVSGAMSYTPRPPPVISQGDGVRSRLELMERSAYSSFR